MKIYGAFCSEISAQDTTLWTKGRSRYGRAVALALLAWPGRISKSPDTQPKPQRERCPHVCHLQATAEEPSQFTLHISAIFLYDKDLPRPTAIIFSLPPVSFAAGSC